MTAGSFTLLSRTSTRAFVFGALFFFPAMSAPCSIRLLNRSHAKNALANLIEIGNRDRLSFFDFSLCLRTGFFELLQCRVGLAFREFRGQLVDFHLPLPDLVLLYFREQHSQGGQRRDQVRTALRARLLHLREDG